jgi:hypothetical protein
MLDVEASLSDPGWGLKARKRSANRAERRDSLESEGITYRIDDHVLIQTSAGGHTIEACNLKGLLMVSSLKQRFISPPFRSFLNLRLTARSRDGFSLGSRHRYQHRAEGRQAPHHRLRVCALDFRSETACCSLEARA